MPAKKKTSYSIQMRALKFTFLILLTFSIVTYYAKDNQDNDYQISDVAYLYDGGSLIGVNEGDRAAELASSWTSVSNQLIKDKNAESVSEATSEGESTSEEATEEATIDNTSLTTKVSTVPSIIQLTTTDEAQMDNIDYVKQETKILNDGFTLTIDGLDKYYFEDDSYLSWLEQTILTAYLPDSSYYDYMESTGDFLEYTVGSKTYTSLGIDNKFTLTDGYVAGANYVSSKEELLFSLLHQNQEEEYTLISDDKSISSIKKDANMSDSEFKLNNPNISENSVTYNGEKIVTNNIDSVLTVRQTYETTKTIQVKYESIREYDSSLLYGQQEVETPGEKGTKEITYETIVENGKAVKTSKLDEKITVPPTNEIIKVGNQSIVGTVTVDGSSNLSDYSNSPASSSGMIWPSSSKSVTCEWMCYTNHTGIDIQSYYGGPIYAAMDGTVTTSGYSPYGYGYYVVIDHGGGVSTLYGHQKQAAPVSVGQKVTQGQVIGFEGATGNVTGEHLHFEVRINGVAQNPRGYIS